MAGKRLRLRALLVAAAAAVVVPVLADGAAAQRREGGPVLAADPPNQTLPYGEVNWGRGYVRISAVGVPPIEGGGAADAARRGAVSMAQKRMLATILDMEGRRGKLRDQVGKRPELKERLRALVTNADVKGKAFADGSVEVTITVPTEGPGGVRALLRDY